MKYRLIDKTTGIETFCDKVTIDGFDYYVSDEHKTNSVHIPKDGIIMEQIVNYNTEEYKSSVRTFGNKNHRFVIATNNSNIDIPQVVDGVEIICINDLQEFYGTDIQLTSEGEKYLSGFKTGYNKSQQTYPFSEDDMIEFAEFYFREEFNSTMQDCKSSKKLLQLWKEQQLKTVYYEN